MSTMSFCTPFSRHSNSCFHQQRAHLLLWLPRTATPSKNLFTRPHSAVPEFDYCTQPAFQLRPMCRRAVECLSSERLECHQCSRSYPALSRDPRTPVTLCSVLCNMSPFINHGNGCQTFLCPNAYADFTRMAKYY